VIDEIDMVSRMRRVTGGLDKLAPWVSVASERASSGVSVAGLLLVAEGSRTLKEAGKGVVSIRIYSAFLDQ